jgi:transcriptional regulator with XRE-family HTH domain
MGSAAYKQRVVSRLRELVDERGMSLAAVEKRLQRGRGYVGDALRGTKKLSLEVILDVLEVLGVPPAEFFDRRSLAGDERGPSPAERQELAPESLPSDLRNAPPMVQALALVLARRGVLDLDELRETHLDLTPPHRDPRSPKKTRDTDG